jgi:hypothetical protein
MRLMTSPVGTNDMENIDGEIPIQFGGKYVLE